MFSSDMKLPGRKKMVTRHVCSVTQEIGSKRELIRDFVQNDSIIMWLICRLSFYMMIIYFQKYCYNIVVSV